MYVIAWLYSGTFSNNITSDSDPYVTCHEVFRASPADKASSKDKSSSRRLRWLKGLGNTCGFPCGFGNWVAGLQYFEVRHKVVWNRVGLMKVEAGKPNMTRLGLASFTPALNHCHGIQASQTRRYSEL